MFLSKGRKRHFFVDAEGRIAPILGIDSANRHESPAFLLDGCIMKGCLVKNVEKGGAAARAGIKPGDRLLSINGCPLTDIIDYWFYSADPVRSITFLAKGEKYRFRFPSSHGIHSLGVELEGIQTRRCHNQCVFCFVHQLPSGLRPSLYVKDEDYRLSFLYGNYITATNLEIKDMDRIIRQRLFPLYISVHATDTARISCRSWNGSNKKVVSFMSRSF